MGYTGFAGFEDRLGHRARAAPRTKLAHEARRHMIASRMHGLIFTTFRDFVTTQYGPAIAESVLAEHPVHVLTEAYPDEDLLAAVAKACELTGLETDELVREFGVFAGETTFPRLYPAYYTLAGGARPFLLTVEDLIHELVRATIPKATPPASV